MFLDLIGGYLRLETRHVGKEHLLEHHYCNIIDFECIGVQYSAAVHKGEGVEPNWRHSSGIVPAGLGYYSAVRRRFLVRGCTPITPTALINR